jgi:hypothetical protein
MSGSIKAYGDGPSWPEEREGVRNFEEGMLHILQRFVSSGVTNAMFPG